MKTVLYGTLVLASVSFIQPTYGQYEKLVKGTNGDDPIAWNGNTIIGFALPLNDMAITNRSKGEIFSLSTTSFYPVTAISESRFRVLYQNQQELRTITLTDAHIIFYSISEAKEYYLEQDKRAASEYEQKIRQLNEKYQAVSDTRPPEPYKPHVHSSYSTPSPQYIYIPSSTPTRYSTYDSKPKSRPTYNGRTIYVGPRGGRYYFSDSGKKVYID